MAYNGLYREQCGNLLVWCTRHLGYYLANYTKWYMARVRKVNIGLNKKHFGFKPADCFYICLPQWRNSFFQVVSLEPQNNIRVFDLRNTGLSPMTIFSFQMQMYIKNGAIEIK